MLFESLYTIQNNSRWGFHCALSFAPLFPVLVLALPSSRSSLAGRLADFLAIPTPSRVLDPASFLSPCNDLIPAGKWGSCFPCLFALVHHVALLGCQVYESQALGKLGRGGHSSGLSCAGILAQEPLLLKPAEKPASMPF